MSREDAYTQVKTENIASSDSARDVNTHRRRPKRSLDQDPDFSVDKKPKFAKNVSVKKAIKVEEIADNANCRRSPRSPQKVVQVRNRSLNETPKSNGKVTPVNTARRNSRRHVASSGSLKEMSSASDDDEPSGRLSNGTHSTLTKSARKVLSR